LPSSTRTKQPHEAKRALERAFEGRAHFPETFETAEEGRAPCAGSQQTCKQDDSVDAGAALARPIGIRVEVEPEGELVEGESGAGAITDGHQAAEEDGNRRMLAAQIKKPSIADEQEDEDPPDEVMDVTSADHHPVKRADVVRDEADQDAHAEKRDDKGERGDEETPARAVGDGGADEKTDAREMEEQQQGGDNNGCKEEENQRALSDNHLPIETL